MTVSRSINGLTLWPLTVRNRRLATNCWDAWTMLMRLKGIKPVRVRKGGREYRYFYHRATGTRLSAEPGTAAFIEEVAALDAKVKRQAPSDGSLHALIVAYRAAPEFTNLAAVTQKDYQRVFDWLQPINDTPLIEFDTALIYALRDKAYQQRKRRFANYVVQVIRLLLEWGKPRNHIAENVAAGVELLPRPKKMPRANRPWGDDERETVLGEAEIGLRVMIALGMFAGLREGDACALPKVAYDGALIESIASKNNEPLWIPAHYRLREILMIGAEVRKARQVTRARRRKVLPIDPPTLAVSSYGKAWTASGFRASFFKLVKRLATEGKVKPGLTFHGLRHTLGKLVIEAGGSKEDVGMILGDRSMAMAELYSREHEKKGRVTATMLRLEQTERSRLEKQKDVPGKPKSG